MIERIVKTIPGIQVLVCVVGVGIARDDSIKLVLAQHTHVAFAQRVEQAELADQPDCLAGATFLFSENGEVHAKGLEQPSRRTAVVLSRGWYAA